MWSCAREYLSVSRWARVARAITLALSPPIKTAAKKKRITG